jgi:hypothetical protein
MPKVYDHAYFEKWYRHPRHAVGSRSELRRKVAMVVGTALGRCRELGLQISDEALAARIQVLAESGRIEDVGDLRKWRFSEVRLRD